MGYATAFSTEQLMEVANKVTSGIHNATDREDAAQEFVLGALTALDRGDSDKPIRALQWSYGFGYVKNFLDMQKKNNFRSNRRVDIHATQGDEDEGDTWISGIPSGELTPPEKLIQQDDCDALNQALQGLNDRERQVLNRHILGGETLEAIGGDYSLSKERVRQIEDRAIEKLRKRL